MNTLAIHTISVEIKECYVCHRVDNLKTEIDTIFGDEMELKTTKLILDHPVCAVCRALLIRDIRMELGPTGKMPTGAQVAKVMKALRERKWWGSSGPTGVTGATGQTGATGTQPSPTGMWGRKGPNRPPKKLGVGGGHYGASKVW